MLTWGNLFLVSSLSLFYLAACILLQWTPSLTVACLVRLCCRGLASTACAILAGVCLDIWKLKPAKSHSLRSIFVQYMVLRAIPLTYGLYASTKFLSQVVICPEIQKRLLLDILSKASNTKYGKIMDFSSIRSVADFKEKQTLSSYENFRKYMEQIIAGEQNVLFPEQPVWFGCTSGTTGRDKLMPLTPRYRKSFLPGYFMGLRSNLNHMPRLGRVLRITVKARPKFTDCGVRIGPISSAGSDSISFHVTPVVCQRIYHEPTVLYTHALFSLAEEDITLIDGMTAQLTYSYFRLIEEKWQILCDDIQAGKINESIELRAEIRHKINSALKPNPARAALLRQEFKKGFKEMAQRIWPNLKFAMMLSTGAFENYTKIVFSSYLSGIHYWSPMYCCTEGFIAVGLSDKDKIGQYIVMPNTNFYEFIPIKDTEMDQPGTLLLHELSVGCSYEVVMTTVCGLFRYRLGDVVKVVDFMEKCPIIEYQYRLGSMLNLAQEFTSENLLYAAIRKAEEQWDDVTLIDYTATDSLALQALGLRQNQEAIHHYVLFIEVTRKGEEHTLSEENKMAIDENLRAGHEGYDIFRENKIAAMEVIQVPCGTFKEVKAALTVKSPNAQFKMPRVLKKKEGLQLLLEQGCRDDKKE